MLHVQTYVRTYLFQTHCVYIYAYTHTYIYIYIYIYKIYSVFVHKRVLHISSRYVGEKSKIIKKARNGKALITQSKMAASLGML